MSNNPVLFTDPLGLWDDDVYGKDDGPYTAWRGVDENGRLLVGGISGKIGFTLNHTNFNGNYSSEQVTEMEYNQYLLNLQFVIGKSVSGLGFNQMISDGDIYLKKIEDEILMKKVLNNVNDWTGYAGNFGEPGVALIGKGMEYGYEKMTTTMQIWTYTKYVNTTRCISVGGKSLGSSATYVGAPLGIYLDFKSMGRKEIGPSRFTYRVFGVAAGIGVGVFYGPISGATTGAAFWSVEKAHDGYMYWQTQMATLLISVENGLKNGWIPGR